MWQTPAPKKKSFFWWWVGGAASLVGIGIVALGGVMWWVTTHRPPELEPRPVDVVRRALEPAGELTYDRAKALPFGETAHAYARFPVQGPRTCRVVMVKFDVSSKRASSVECDGVLPDTEVRAAVDRLHGELRLQQPVATTFRRASTFVYGTTASMQDPVQLHGRSSQKPPLNDDDYLVSTIAIVRNPCPPASSPAECDARFSDAVRRMLDMATGSGS